MTSFQSSTRVLKIPGKVIAAPTSLTAGATGEYGGTIIGSTRAVALVAVGRPYVIQCEGRGEPSDVLESNKHYNFNFFLRGWDQGAVSNLLAGGYTEGSVTKNAVWQEPGTKTPGQSSGARGLVWLIVPDDTQHHPALIIRSGIPDIQDGAEFAFQRREEFGLSISIECLRDASNQIFDLGHLEDLTL